MSLIEELLLNMKNPSIKFNLAVGLIIGIIIFVMRIGIKYVLLSDMANKGLNYTPENQKKLLIKNNKSLTKTVGLYYWFIGSAKRLIILISQRYLHENLLRVFL